MVYINSCSSSLSLAISKSTFDSEASGAVLDLMGDDDKEVFAFDLNYVEKYCIIC